MFSHYYLLALIMAAELEGLTPRPLLNIMYIIQDI